MLTAVRCRDAEKVMARQCEKGSGPFVCPACSAEAILVKGRQQPFIDTVERTPHGVVVAIDRERRLAYTVRWSGFEPGAAAELAALALDRAGTWSEFRSALEHWKMPARRVTYTDVDRNVGFQDAALVPVRRSGEWARWMTIDELPHALNPAAGSVTATEPRREPAATDRQAVFAHVLGVGRAAQERFNIGPLDRPDVDDGPVRVVFTPADWDLSRAINAPGQSGSPASPYFADLARLWSTGDSFPLPFSDRAVHAATASTLLLVPQSTAGARQ